MDPVKAGAILGALAVIAGAFGAHALKGVLAEDALASFQTAVRYQMWHALALLFLGGVKQEVKTRNGVALFWCWGTILFSGSIYFLHLGPLLSGTSWRFLGPVTPVGGLLLILGWSLLFIAQLKKRKKYTK